MTLPVVSRGELVPLIVDWNRREFFDPEIMKEFGKLGFLGAHCRIMGAQAFPTFHMV